MEKKRILREIESAFERIDRANTGHSGAALVHELGVFLMPQRADLLNLLEQLEETRCQVVRRLGEMGLSCQAVS